jgi:hypothetical protein
MFPRPACGLAEFLARSATIASPPRIGIPPRTAYISWCSRPPAGAVASGKAVTAFPPGRTVVLMKSLIIAPCPTVASHEDCIGPATWTGRLQVALPSAEETNQTPMGQFAAVQCGS